MDLFGRHKFFKGIGLSMEWDLKKPEKPKKATKKQLKEYEAKLEKWKEGKAAALKQQSEEMAREERRRREEERERENRIEYEAPGVGRRWINDGRGGYYVYFAHDTYDGNR